MQIPQYRRITETDFKDMPSWFIPIADNINRHIELLTTLAQGNWTFEENSRGEVVDLDMEHDVSTPIKLNVLKRNPTMALVVGSQYFEYPNLAWGAADEPLTVNAKVKWDIEPTEKVRVKLLFLGQSSNG